MCISHKKGGGQNKNWQNCYCNFVPKSSLVTQTPSRPMYLHMHAGPSPTLRPHHFRSRVLMSKQATQGSVLLSVLLSKLKHIILVKLIVKAMTFSRVSTSSSLHQDAKTSNTP